MDDPSCTESLDVVTRDAIAREGAETNQVFTRAQYAVNLPQQAVYYCANQENPNLMFAGLFSMIEINAIAVNTTIGMVTCHYEIEFLSASSIRFAGQTVRTVSDNTCAITGQTMTINQAFFATIANWGVNLAPGEVGVCVMTSFADGGANVAWRSLRFGDDRETLNLGQGVRLWFRLDSPGANILFFPADGGGLIGHDAATDPGTPSDALINSFTQAIPGVTTMSMTQIRIWKVLGSSN